MSSAAKKYSGPTAHVRARNPQLPQYWSLAELVRQAGLHGVPTSRFRISQQIDRGEGPEIHATVGKSVAIMPEAGRRWIKRELKRMAPQPSAAQRALGINESNFASI